MPSGFGNVTRFVCDGLVRAGHDVHILGWGASGASRDWNGATLHGVGLHPMGADVLLSQLYRLRPDYLITLGDVWWLTFLTSPTIEQFFRMTSTRWVQYFPIDGNRPDGSLPPSWLEMLRRADVPVAMSRYGQQVTRAAGIACEYIPHGVETSVFRPAGDLQAAKARFGYQDRFVILSDARNQPRKMLPRLLSAFERFARGRPDALLHVHCDPRDTAATDPRYSYRIDADVEALGLHDQVRFTSGFQIRGGLSLPDLVAIYQAADAHVLVSTGEGFGLPTLQAAACGLVPLAPAYTANLELLDRHGLPVRVAEFLTDEFGVARAYIDVDDLVGHWDSLYRDRASLRQRSREARAFAEPYDWSRVLPMWNALLERHASVSKISRLGAPRRLETVALGAGLTARVGGELPSPLSAAVRGSVEHVPAGVSITLSVSEQRMGEVTRQVLDDTLGDGGAPWLNVPIGCTERDSPAARTIGRVYLGRSPGEATSELFEALQGIFPVLESETEVLSDAMLALDLEGNDPQLPRLGASLGVPTIGPDSPWQRLLWPDLTAHPGNALRLARDVLADFPTTSDLVARARSTLAHHTTLPTAPASELRVAV
jgi:glycosyltransferase involved in cell wall biosynthesis